MPPGKIKIDDGAGNYTILTNAGSLGSDKTITIPNTTGTLALTSDSFGKVLQVVTAETTTGTTSTSTTYSDTTLTGSITPSATSSKVLVLISQQYNFYATNTTFIKAGIKLVRTISATDTDLWETSGFTLNSGSGSAAQWGGVLPITILDSPSTTSSITYKTQQHKETTDTTIITQAESEKSTITLIEIGA